MLNLEVVTPTYFEAIGTPLLAGRGFAETDGLYVAGAQPDPGPPPAAGSVAERQPSAVAESAIERQPSAATETTVERPPSTALESTTGRQPLGGHRQRERGPRDVRVPAGRGRPAVHRRPQRPALVPHRRRRRRRRLPPRAGNQRRRLSALHADRHSASVRGGPHVSRPRRRAGDRAPRARRSGSGTADERRPHHDGARRKSIGHPIAGAGSSTRRRPTRSRRPRSRYCSAAWRSSRASCRRGARRGSLRWSRCVTNRRARSTGPAREVVACSKW